MSLFLIFPMKIEENKKIFQAQIQEDIFLIYY